MMVMVARGGKWWKLHRKRILSLFESLQVSAYLSVLFFCLKTKLLYASITVNDYYRRKKIIFVVKLFSCSNVFQYIGNAIVVVALSFTWSNKPNRNTNRRDKITSGFFFHSLSHYFIRCFFIQKLNSNSARFALKTHIHFSFCCLHTVALAVICWLGW